MEEMWVDKSPHAKFLRALMNSRVDELVNSQKWLRNLRYIAEKSIFFDETFFVASGCPSSTSLPNIPGIRPRRTKPHPIEFIDPPLSTTFK